MKRPLDPRVPEDDVALFRAAVRDAVPLRAPARRATAQPAHPPVPVQSLLDEHAALDESRNAVLDDETALETGEDIAYVREGVSRQVLRRLRRGHWVVQDQLDLHGLTRASCASARVRPCRSSWSWTTQWPRRSRRSTCRDTPSRT